MLREHVVGSRRGMVAYLGSDQLRVSTVRQASQGRTACPLSRTQGSIPCIPTVGSTVSPVEEQPVQVAQSMR